MAELGDALFREPADVDPDAVDPFDAISEEFAAGHEAGYVEGVCASAESSAHAIRGALATAQRRYNAGHRQGLRDACALLFACLFAWWAGQALADALAPFVAPKNSSFSGGGAR